MRLCVDGVPAMYGGFSWSGFVFSRLPFRNLSLSGLPSSVGEVMACGTPCVVTDVGDSALIVGDSGRVVVAQNPDELAAAWRELIEGGPGVRRHLGMTARLRVEQHFSLPLAVERYQAIYAQLSGEARPTIPSPGLAKYAE
jgi:glycosyltransferase involved in cell wall biosynthesis